VSGVGAHGVRAGRELAQRTHRVAYESQLKSDRAQVHRRLAAAFEAREPDSADANAALIAEHRAMQRCARTSGFALAHHCSLHLTTGLGVDKLFMASIVSPFAGVACRHWKENDMDDRRRQRQMKELRAQIKACGKCERMNIHAAPARC
jgi:hypothetical protein